MPGLNSQAGQTLTAHGRVTSSSGSRTENRGSPQAREREARPQPSTKEGMRVRETNGHSAEAKLPAFHRQRRGGREGKA